MVESYPSTVLDLTASISPTTPRRGWGSLRFATDPEAALLPALTGVLCYATVAQGGFYRGPGALIAAALFTLALASWREISGTQPFFVAMAIMAAGAIVPGFITGWGPNAPLAIAGWVSATAGFPIAIAMIRRGEGTRLLEAVALIGAGTSAVGLFGIVFHLEPFALVAQGLWRNSSLLTYANAAGALYVLTLGAAMLLLLERATLVRRLMAFLIMLGWATTLSRGAFLGALGAAVVIACSRQRRVILAMVPSGLGALLAFGGFIPSIAGDDRVWLPALALVAGAALSMFGINRGGRARVVGMIVMAALVATFVGGPAIGRVVERRALPTSETRLRTWASTLTLALEQPAFGTGLGTFALVEEDGPGLVLTRYVHNEYLQAFFETGAVGLGAIFVGAALLATWAWRRRRSDAQGLIAGAMCSAFAIHSAFDFIWRMPLLLALASIWLAVAVAPHRTEGENR